MVLSKQNKGKCYICKKELTKGGMKSHLLKCNELGNGKTKYFLLKVEGFYDKNYWLFLQANVNTTLYELDDFLRDIWLECCGHLSSFTIDGVTYDKPLDEEVFMFMHEMDENEDMKEFELKDILKKNMNFIHEYDFGDTTKLKITVVDSYVGDDSKEKISLLARNNKAEYNCVKCAEKATFIGISYDSEDSIPLCDDCMENYCEDEDEDIYLIPISNSPRMGVCGYEGANDVYELD